MEQQLICESLDRICKSASFIRSQRMQRFLRYVVEQALNQGAESLKEYAIAVAVYEKDQSFDPRLDPIVRVEASRLRLRLMEYYAGAGRDERVVIDVPKGSYHPTFRMLEEQNRGLIPGTASNTSIASVAVLPFENATGDPDSDYISESLAESLTAQISRIGSVDVCPTLMSRHFKPQFDSGAVAAELGVSYLITGRFTFQDNAIMVRIELINAAKRLLVWSSGISCRIGSAGRFEDSILPTVWQELAPHLGVAPHSFAPLLSVRPEAHHLYLKGRFAWNKRTKVGLMSAVDFFGRCLEMDPTFATAYAGLADSYIALGTFGALAPNNSFPRGIAAALRALELNPELGEARVSLATAKAFYETDWKAAGDEFRDALRKNPNYATGHHWYGCYLFALGRMDQSISELKIAQELDPLSPIISVQLASAYHFDRQYALACEMCRNVLELDSQFWVARWFLGMSLEQLGQRDEALKQLRLAGEGSEQNALAVAALAHCHADSGHAEQAETILAKLRARARNEYVPGYALALILVSIGCVEVAFDELEAARRENSPMLAMFLGVDPRWDAIRAEKRFTGLMKSLHLRPDAWSPLRETAQRKNQ